MIFPVNILCLCASGFNLSPKKSSNVRIGVFSKPRFSCSLACVVTTENLLCVSALFVYLLLLSEFHIFVVISALSLNCQLDHSVAKSAALMRQIVVSE